MLRHLISKWRFAACIFVLFCQIANHLIFSEVCGGERCQELTGRRTKRQIVFSYEAISREKRKKKQKRVEAARAWRWQKPGQSGSKTAVCQKMNYIVLESLLQYLDRVSNMIGGIMHSPRQGIRPLGASGKLIRQIGKRSSDVEAPQSSLSERPSHSQ